MPAFLFEQATPKIALLINITVQFGIKFAKFTINYICKWMTAITSATGTLDNKSLIDPFGRSITYLRLSVTDRCDFRCRYCMAEEMTFLPRETILTLEELALVSQAFVELGVKKIRLTGGEPLVRKNITWLTDKLGQLGSLDELTLTTNGSQLSKHAEDLVSSGIKRLNISLDTLDEKAFNEITRTGHLQDVLNGIQAAKNAGIKRIKLNAVILKGRNDDQIIPLVEFALSNKCDISFIEEMPLGDINDHSRSEMFISSNEIQKIIHDKYPLQPAFSNTLHNGPSRYWQTEKGASKIGFISPHSNNFCDSCNRVRVTAEGKLLLCLGHENAVDLRAVLREPNHSDRDNIELLKIAIISGLTNKPQRHEFTHDDEPAVIRFMNMTGG